MSYWQAQSQNEWYQNGPSNQGQNWQNVDYYGNYWDQSYCEQTSEWPYEEDATG